MKGYDHAYWQDRKAGTQAPRTQHIFAIKIPGCNKGEGVNVECNEATLESFAVDGRDRRLKHLPLTCEFVDGRYVYELVSAAEARRFRAA